MIEGKRVKARSSRRAFYFHRCFFRFCLLRKRRITRRHLFIRVDSILSPFDTLHRGMIHPLLIALVSLVRSGPLLNRFMRRTRRTLGRMTGLQPWLSPNSPEDAIATIVIPHAREQVTDPNTIASFRDHIPSSASLCLFLSRSGNPCNRNQTDDRPRQSPRQRNRH